jgi:hypothetical protein
MAANHPARRGGRAAAADVSGDPAAPCPLLPRGLCAGDAAILFRIAPWEDHAACAVDAEAAATYVASKLDFVRDDAVGGRCRAVLVRAAVDAITRAESAAARRTWRTLGLQAIDSRGMTAHAVLWAETLLDQLVLAPTVSLPDVSMAAVLLMGEDLSADTLRRFAVAATAAALFAVGDAARAAMAAMEALGLLQCHGLPSVVPRELLAMLGAEAELRGGGGEVLSGMFDLLADADLLYDGEAFAEVIAAFGRAFFAVVLVLGDRGVVPEVAEALHQRYKSVVSFLGAPATTR